jgi:hypothetical protein
MPSLQSLPVSETWIGDRGDARARRAKTALRRHRHAVHAAGDEFQRRMAVINAHAASKSTHRLTDVPVENVVERLSLTVGTAAVGMLADVAPPDGQGFASPRVFERLTANSVETR